MNLLNSERGEVVLMIGLFISMLACGVALKEQEREHKKQMHYQQYHEDAVKKQKELEESLEKSKLYRI